MELFGAFAAGRILDSGNGATVYEATREGDPKGQYIVKVFSPERLLAEEQQEAKTELDPLFKDIGASFTSRVNLQKQAAESSPLFAPILAAGRDERGAWYASKFYPRSINGMLERFVALETPDLVHVVHSVTLAAIHLKKIASRSHGNLKPGNIFIDGSSKPRNSQVIVSDPLPGDAKEAARYEQADLRAIGELLYQLVLRRKVDFSTGWVILPIESSKEWTQLFDQQASDWLALCNKLLDPKLSPDSYSLEDLQADLARLKPKRPVALTLAPIAAVAVLVIGVGLFWFLKPKATKIIVTTDPPGAEIIVASEDGSIKRTNQTALDGSPLEFKLQQGDYSIRARYRELDVPRITVSLKTGQQLKTNLSFAYGGLIVLSEPANATFWIRTAVSTNLVKTPYTNQVFKPGAVTFQLDLKGYVSAFVEGVIQSNKVATVLRTNLVPPQAGEGIVEFTSDPPGAQILIDGEPVARTSADGVPVSIKRMEGRYRATARLSGWADKEVDIVVRKEAPAQQSFYFEHGTLIVETSEPEKVQILLDGQLAGVSPATIFLPPGDRKIAFTADGFDTNQESILVADRGRYTRTPRLNPKSGFVDLVSDPPGAQIRVTEQSGRVITNLVAETSRRLFLQKGTYLLHATYPDLDPIDVANVAIKPGERTTIPAFNFAYGLVSFTNAQAGELEPKITRKNDGKAIGFGEALAQKPDATVEYQVEAPAGYENTTFALAVRRNLRTNIFVRLQKQKVPVALTSNLQGAKPAYWYLDETNREVALGEGPDFRLPWANQVVFIARYTNLTEVRRTNDVPRTGRAEPLAFPFEYATVITTNLTAGTQVYCEEQGREYYHGTAPAPLLVKPGESKFNLMFSGTSLARTNHLIDLRGLLVLTSPGKPPWRSKTTGMEFVWVSGLPGAPGGGAYVSKYEVAQEQFNQVMGQNPSSTIGSNLPVNNVSYQSAEQFCSRLTQSCEQQSDLPPGPDRYVYVLPSREQWQYFASGTKPEGAILSDGSKQLYRKVPEVIGSSAVTANKFGLQDLLGNVAELCKTDGANSYGSLGGSYTVSIGRLSTIVDTNGVFRVAAFTEPLPQIGFRVVLFPSAQ